MWMYICAHVCVRVCVCVCVCVCEDVKWMYVKHLCLLRQQLHLHSSLAEGYRWPPLGKAQAACLPWNVLFQAHH